MTRVSRVLFFEPQVAGNTGNAIRMAAGSGAELHLVNPRFDFEDAMLRRAGLDYHDLAVVTVHDSFEAALEQLLPCRIFAVTDALRVPMLSGRRSMNLANCAAVATYEAWRQQGFLGNE